MKKQPRKLNDDANKSYKTMNSSKNESHFFDDLLDNDDDEVDGYVDLSSNRIASSLNFSLDTFIKRANHQEEEQQSSSSIRNRSSTSSSPPVQIISSSVPKGRSQSLKPQKQTVTAQPTRVTSRKQQVSNSSSSVLVKESSASKSTNPSVSNEDFFELMQQQISALQLRNMELSQELEQQKQQHQNIIIDDRDKGSPITNYYRPTAIDLSTVVTIDNVKQGLFACDISNSLITKNTKQCMYNKKDDDEEDNESRPVRKTVPSDSNRVDLFNLYEFNSKDLERQRSKSWCDTKSLKSIKQKKNLLYSCYFDSENQSKYESVPIHHDATICTILMMEQSLNFEDFMDCLSGDQNRHYLTIYIGYLSQSQDYDQLFRVYKYHKLVYDEFILKLRLALKIRDPLTRMDEIESLLAQYKLSNPNNVVYEYLSQKNLLTSDYGQHLIDSVNLLSKQITIEGEDSKALSDTTSSALSRLVESSIADTLNYLLFYHTDADSTQVFYPESMIPLFRISRHRYLYQAALAHCKLKDWDSVEGFFQMACTENLLTVSSFEHASGRHSSIKSKLQISTSGTRPITGSRNILSAANFIRLVMEYEGPKLLLEFILSKCTDPFEKFELAKSCKCYEVAVTCAVKELKDKELILHLRKELSKTKEYQLVDHIDNVLNNKGWLKKIQSKWF
jgi:hypothetical protein